MQLADVDLLFARKSYNYYEPKSNTFSSLTHTVTHLLYSHGKPVKRGWIYCTIDHLQVFDGVWAFVQHQCLKHMHAIYLVSIL